MTRDLMTVGETREYLGIGKAKMAKLISEGTLPTQPDPLDKRVRLIRRADVKKLAEQSSKRAA